MFNFNLVRYEKGYVACLLYCSYSEKQICKQCKRSFVGGKCLVCQQDVEESLRQDKKKRKKEFNYISSDEDSAKELPPLHVLRQNWLNRVASKIYYTFLDKKCFKSWLLILMRVIALAHASICAKL